MCAGLCQRPARRVYLGSVQRLARRPTDPRLRGLRRGVPGSHTHGGDDGTRTRACQLDGLVLLPLSYATMEPMCLAAGTGGSA